jgi:NADH-quinone oxidoreductase subunit H
MNVITMSAVAVTLFLGGPSGPGLGFLGADNFVNVWLMPLFWFFAKLIALLFCTWWVRASLPRMRYDRLMALGWKYLIEIAILWVIVAASIEVADVQNWNVWLTVLISFGSAAIAYAVLFLSIPRRYEQVEDFR